MPACVGAFIECTSLSVSYDVLGMATVNYTVVMDIRGSEDLNISMR